MHVSGEGSNVQLMDMIIRENTAFPTTGGILVARGGAVFATEGATVNVTSSLIFNNTGGYGAGIAAAVGGKLWIKGCTFVGNHGIRGGSFGVQAGISAVDGILKRAEAYVTDTTVRDTIATKFGAGFYNLGSYVEIERSSFLRLSVGIWGGAYWSVSGMIWANSPGEVHLSHTLFENCSALSGGALGNMDFSQLAENQQLLRMRHVTVRGGRATSGQGGGGYLFQCNIDARYIVFDDCESNGEGGGLSLRGTKTDSPPTFQTPTSRTADRMVLAWVAAPGTDNAEVVFEDGNFIDCFAVEEGGAIAAAPSDQVLTMRRVTVLRARSGTRGGALRFHGRAQLIDTHWIECSSHNDCGAFDFTRQSTSL